MSADVLALFPDGPPERGERRSVLGDVRSFRGRVHHRDRGCQCGPVDYTNPFWTECHHCVWGAFTCAVCGASEGEVASDCPGRPTTEEERDGVLAGRLDYVQAAGGWVRASDREKVGS